jgi:hypothetical protein
MTGVIAAIIAQQSAFKNTGRTEVARRLVSLPSTGVESRIFD